MSKVDKHPTDWASASVFFDNLLKTVGTQDLSAANEAQTRFDVVDKLICEVLGWQTGQIQVEERTEGVHLGFVDYTLRVGDATIIIEAKKIGAAFPSPTPKKRLKISGSILGAGEISKAIKQAEEYAFAKEADVVCVTNGACWCFFSTNSRNDNSYATLLFPFQKVEQAEELFEVLAESKVRNGSLEGLLNSEPKPENRLLSILRDADGRLNRNNIADHISPALNSALYADALMSNPRSLEKCFVTTEGRSKFDSLLGMHLADPRPTLVQPAPRIKTSKKRGPLEELVGSENVNHAPPVTLIIGPVGAGKSTYLKHFELISGREVLAKQGAHWIYVDFEHMGEAGEPRSFMYEKLKDYLLGVKPTKDTDYKSLVEPAYEEIVEGLRKGPFARISGDKVEFDRRVTDIIESDLNKVEPYVDRLFSHLAKKQLSVIVMDNIDLYEDENLETKVFSEGLALSKRLNCHVIVCIRDRTYVRHRNTPTFNAYELRKLWLDPPPFKSVLSKRLTYSRKILEKKPAKIPMENGMQLKVPDLGIFFEIVQRSVLSGSAGEYIEDMSDLNIRHGLNLINNFLISGHIQADKALKIYLTEGDTRYSFPFHEVFKGTTLAQWKNYKEARAECINLFDAHTGVKRTRLLRLSILGHLASKARSENTLEVAVSECIDIFASLGASDIDVIEVLETLYENNLVRTISAEPVGPNGRIVISKSGGYYLKKLCHTFVYTEQVMMDTAIEDPDKWSELSELTHQIEKRGVSIPERMRIREKRITSFMDYLASLESQMLKGSKNTHHLQLLEGITKDVLQEAQLAVTKASRYFNE